MAKLTKRLITKALGGGTAKSEGYRRSLKGLREGDNRELSLGLALTALSYLQNTKPKKELLFRREVPEGSALVIRHTRRGTPKLEIKRP